MRVIRAFPRTVLAIGVILSLVTACAAPAATAPTATAAKPSAAAATAAPSAAPSSAIPAGADPKLAAIYTDVVQKEMPGVPFSLLEGAAKEGKVTFYHIRLPTAHTPLIAAFKQKFPMIAVEEYEDSGPPLVERFLTEQRAKTARVDVMQTTSVPQMDDLVAEGYIADYKITSESKFDPASYKSGVRYPYSITTQVVYAYNTKLVTEAEAKVLEKYEGLWDPSLQGKRMSVVPPPTEAGGQLYFYYIDKTFGRTAWQKLRAMNPRYLGATAAAQALASGEIALGEFSEAQAIATLTSGAPIRWKVPLPALSQFYSEAVVKSAPHPNAARLFHEFVMSKTGQEFFAKNVYPSARSDVGDLRAVVKQDWYTKNIKNYSLDTADFAKALAGTMIDDWKKLYQ